MFDARPSPDYRACLASLRARVAEPAPGRIQLLSGPRQVGKTSLLLELSQELGARALYAAADGPEASLPGFWEQLWLSAEQVAAAHGKSVVLLDEVHFIGDWATRLKGQWDKLRRARTPVHVIATGSSALKLASGSRESLAGRFERTNLTHWSAASLASVFQLTRSEAVDACIRLGTYPGAIGLRGEPERFHAYVRDAIIEPAIGRDMLALGTVRKPALLRQVFAVCAGAPAEIVSLQKMQGLLRDAGALETISHYLQLLEEAQLVAPLSKYSKQVTRSRAAPPKLVPLSNAIMAVAGPHVLSNDKLGRWIENACIAHAYNSGQKVSYWREEPMEVDFICEGNWGAFAIEVKTGAFSPLDLRSVSELTRRHPELTPLVLCEEAAVAVARQYGVRAQYWADYLFDGPLTT